MFDNVHVPAENIIGTVDAGFKIVLSKCVHQPCDDVVPPADPVTGQL